MNIFVVGRHTRKVGPGGCRPRTAHAESFKYPGFRAMLDNTAPGLGME